MLISNICTCLMFKAGLYRIWCGVNTLGDSGMHTLGGTSAFVNPAGQLLLTISVLQACCAVTTEYSIPSDFVRKLTASLQIKISTAQLNFSNRNVIIF